MKFYSHQKKIRFKEIKYHLLILKQIRDLDGVQTETSMTVINSTFAVNQNLSCGLPTISPLD